MYFVEGSRLGGIVVLCHVANIVFSMEELLFPTLAAVVAVTTMTILGRARPSF